MNQELSQSIRGGRKFRNSHRLLAFFSVAGVLLAGCSQSDRPASNAEASAKNVRISELSRIKEAVEPFFQPMQSRDHDWLQDHPENGETFEEYTESKPILPTTDRKTIYILPVGNFTPAERKMLNLTAEYMRAFYDLPVKLNPERPLGNVPKGQSRKVYGNKLQIRSGYFLNAVLPKLLPNDAAALVCFTNYDLYPEDTWSFVFGQASLEDRVGVWSLSRLGGGKADGKISLSRTLKIAIHETGHMFSMRHCTKYECLMSGTNSLMETDRRPLDACPECMAKIAWAMKYDPETRYRNLSEFWRKQGWPDEQKAMADKANAVFAAGEKR
ncbi:MAG: hypothetical protein H7070_04660 [Saprospiraceae bacterium]|nr:hypothetical protein [Pyrinomonadaceae bacterium]